MKIRVLFLLISISVLNCTRIAGKCDINKGEEVYCVTDRIELICQKGSWLSTKDNDTAISRRALPDSAGCAKSNGVTQLTDNCPQGYCN